MRVRLQTKQMTSKPVAVDRTGSGKIIGASIMAAGEALGHGFWIDGKTLDQVASLATQHQLKGRWTHGNLCADGLGTHLGRWENVRRDGDRVVGDFVFSASAKNVKPSGLAVDAPTYLMDLAESEPDAAGVSAVLDLGEFEEREEADGKRLKLARVERASRGDWVADPAANPSGMFAETPSALAEAATQVLAEAEEIHGEEKVAGFLRTYLAAKTNSTEDRVTLDEMKAKHADELAARDAKIAALEAGLKAANEAEAQRRAKGRDAYLAGLQAKAVALQCPLAEADLAKVRALLDRGDDETAHLVGDLLLQKAEAFGARVEPGETKTIPLGAKGDTYEEASARGRSRLFAAAGLADEED